jgi:pullulanase/glycogen debranching enzyme
MDARLELPSARVLQRSRLREGHGFPLGATWTGLGVNFALFSAHATKVELCLFDEQGEREIERIELPEFTDEAKGSRRDDRVRSRFAEARLDANGTLRIYRG